MTTDDRELSERLAAIESEPREQWTRELRADLIAAWDTGDAPTFRVERVTFETRRDRRPSMWSVVVTAALTAAAVAAALVLVGDDDAVAPRPISPDTTNETVGTTTPASSVPGTPVIGTRCDHSADRYTYTSSAVWTMSPVACGDADGLVESLSLTSQPFDGGESRRLLVGLDDLRAAEPDFDVGIALQPWGFLALAGITDEAAYLRTPTVLLRIDLATEAVSSVRFSAAPAPDPVYTSAVCFMGDTVVISTADGLFVPDFSISDLQPVTFPATSAACRGVVSPMDVVVPPAGDDLWGYDAADPSGPLTRMGADGTVSTTPRLDVSIFALYPGGSPLWAIAYHLDEPTGLSPVTPAHLMRLDPTTGSVLAELPNPPNSFSMSFRAFPSDEGVLAVSDRYRAWWVTNEGVSETIAPLDLDIVGVTGSTYIGLRDDGTVAVGPIDSLPRVEETCGGANPAVLALVTATAEAVWTLVPSSCTEAPVALTGVTISMTPIGASEPSATFEPPLDEPWGLAAPQDSRSGLYDGVWRNLALVGATDSMVVMRTDSQIIWVTGGVQGGTAQGLALPEPDPSFVSAPSEPVLMTSDGAVFVVHEGTLLRADPVAGTWTAVPGVPSPVTVPGSDGPLSAVVPAAPSHLLVLDGASRRLLWVDGGGVRRTTPTDGLEAAAYFARGDALWAVGLISGGIADTLYLTRLDPATGAVLTEAADRVALPCGNTPAVFVTRSGAYGFCGVTTWRGNDGSHLESFTAPPGTPVGVLGEDVVVVRPDARVEVMTRDVLLAADARQA